MDLKMYLNTHSNEFRRPVNKESLKIKGKSKNNIVLESENNVVNLPSYEFTTSLETDLKKTKNKLKSLEGLVNRMLTENVKLRNELASLKQFLGRT